MFSEKEKNVNANVHVFHKLLEAAIGVLLKSDSEKIHKINEKASIVESFFKACNFIKDSATAGFRVS